MKPKNIQVRLASANEAGAIQKITTEAFKKYAHQAGLETVAAINEALETVKEDIKTKIVFVAYLDQKPVGSVRITPVNSKTAYLSRFAVVAGHQNNGIGKELMLAVDERMQQQGIERLELHTSSKIAHLVRFYYSCGFYIDNVDNSYGYPRALFIKDYTSLLEWKTFQHICHSKP